MRFNKFRDELNLSKEIKFYSWKHSGASELKDAGANMYEIQRHFRHKSVTTTEQYWRKRLGGTKDNIKKSFPDI
jgi:integrase